MGVEYVSWFSIAVVFSGWVCVALGTCPQPACEVRVRIESGWVRGRVRAAEDGSPYVSFRGVPYAKPPLAERRFKELEPPEPWDYVYDAAEDSAACPQKDFIYSRLPLQLKGQSEDCLYMNVHAPVTALPKDNSKNNLVPVIVVVHGGGFQAGAGLTDMHGPEYLLRNDVVVMTFNHRINIFGYLSLDTAKIPGNQALRDVIFFLRWVQRNARAFGGNPDDVTLLGHSTGATVAHLVSLSLPARGLIHKVILMSGTAHPNYFSTSKAHAKNVANRLLTALGINSTDTDEIHERLTQEPLINLMYALNIVQSKGDVILLNLVPVVESKFPDVTTVIDDDPFALMREGRGREYPLVVGFTTGEFNYFKLQILSSDIVKRLENDATILLPARLRDHFPRKEQERLANEMKKWYFKKEVTLDEAILSYSDMYYVQPALAVAEWRSYWGAPVYLYQFAYESERNIIKEANWCKYTKVAHVEDLTYLFRINSLLQDYVAFPPKNNDDLMKEWLPTLFTNFARCSNPTCTTDEAQWPPLAPGRLQYQNIGVPKVYEMRNLTARQHDVLQLYEQLDEQTRNVVQQLRKHKKSRD
uniref:Carboxylic ester hydrolase n=1 Tax=Ectropis obliqua TaxID=248899 RepID=A0A2U3T8L0_ECTOB|nr:putative antennal esterase CXE23 [Ectropis obliqua]